MKTELQLQAVFWDYPRFLDRDYLTAFLKENKDTDMFDWLMTRFLEHGRVVDVFQFYSIREIAERLHRLKLSEYSARKWRRLVEVYDSDQGK